MGGSEPQGPVCDLIGRQGRYVRPTEMSRLCGRGTCRVGNRQPSDRGVRVGIDQRRLRPCDVYNPSSYLAAVSPRRQRRKCGEHFRDQTGFLSFSTSREPSHGIGLTCNSSPRLLSRHHLGFLHARWHPEGGNTWCRMQSKLRRTDLVFQSLHMLYA